MKIHNPKVFLKDGELYGFTVDLPEYVEHGCNGKPWCCPDDECQWVSYQKEYQNKIESAKASAVRIQNNNEVYDFIWGIYLKKHNAISFQREENLFNGKEFYTLTGYVIDIKCEHTPEYYPEFCSRCMGNCISKIGVISPIEKQEVKQESQDSVLTAFLKERIKDAHQAIESGMGSQFYPFDEETTESLKGMKRAYSDILMHIHRQVK